MEYNLEMQDICKTYYGEGGTEIRANDHVNFTLKKGEIHALLGENGAGKSTLVRNLSRRPDSGTILISGKEVVINNPVDTIEHGIGIAYQDLTKTLVERHTIAENILSVAKGLLFSLKKIEAEIRDTLKEYDLDELDPNMKIWKLSGGEKQRVEILKALITNPNIVILDEPTSMLTPLETKKLFTLLKTMKQQGKSAVIITHHLEEAIEISDRITVMRQGKVVEVLDEVKVNKLRENMDEGIHLLANLMVGQEVLYDLKKLSLPESRNTPLLQVQELRVDNDMSDEVVRGVNIIVKENHILGLAGIAGNGQRELVESILRLRKAKSGQILIRGKNMANKSIRDVKKAGVSYLPEDRSKALVYDLSIRENLITYDYLESKGRFFNIKSIVKKTDALIEKYQIKTPGALTPVRSLSGGNKQKVVVARELSRQFDENLFIIAENPTIGLDVGTTQFVRQELLGQRDTGAGILLVSSDLTEILALSDEIAVIYNGQIMGTIKANNATREKIGLMMGGIKLKSIDN